MDSMGELTPSRIVRHSAVNDIIVRSLSSAGIPASEEPTDLTVVPWQGGKSVTWDITVVSTLSRSYTSMPQGILMAAPQNSPPPARKHAFLPPQRYHSVTIVLETLGATVPCSLN